MGLSICQKRKRLIFCKKYIEFVTETSFDFLGICDIIYHAEENGKKQTERK